MRRKVCVVTGSRAEYGLLKSLLSMIKGDPDFQLQLIVTGTHLSSAHGFTYKEIEADRFQISKRIDLKLSGDTPVSISHSMGIAMDGFGKAFDGLKPDILIILGDRFEIFCAAAVALIANIPIAHIHGGELTEGSTDDAMRHSITKMAHLHFVSSAPYARRVMQLGEDPHCVFVVGGLGVEAIRESQLYGKEETEEYLGLKFAAKNLLVTYHPETLSNSSSLQQIQELLKALALLRDTKLIFTLPNSDVGSEKITHEIIRFCAQNPNAYFFKSLGQKLYFSCMQYVDGVVGNSSSGILEAPSFKKGTINIGDRQKGRIQAASVINCVSSSSDISSSIDDLYSSEFQRRLSETESPYEKGGGSQKIYEILKASTLNKTAIKKFYDL